MSFLERYGPWALVTGASSGLGLAIARELAGKGANLVLVARRAHRLDALAAELTEAHGIEVRVEPLDLTEPDAIDALIASLSDIDLGFVAHAAGFGNGGPHFATPLQRHRQMLALNCGVTLELAHALLPGLAARGKGGLMLFGSIVSIQGVPWSSHYSATKAYVMALGEGLQVEAAQHGVDVCVVAPGPTATEFFGHAGMTASTAASPEAVARVALARMGRPGIVWPDWFGLAVRWALATAPRFIGVRIMARIMGDMTGTHRAERPALTAS